ncbi:MAG: penicillin-binding protein activator [bacterium]
MLHKNRSRFLSLVLCCLLGLTGSIQAQVATTIRRVPEVEPEFQQALAAYNSGHYQLALAKFQKLSRPTIVHQMVTASLLMTGKTLYKLERYGEAEIEFNKLINRFPVSTYVDDAYYGKAEVNYRQNKYLKAVKDLFWVLDKSVNKKLLRMSSRLANFIMNSELNLADLRKLVNFARSENSVALLTIQLARRELSIGSSDKAAAILREYKRKYRSSTYLPQIDQLLKETESGKLRALRVGVLLPLTGYFAKEGLGVLRGIQYGQSENQNNSETPIQLVIRDTESNAIRAINEVKELIKRENVRVVIGELESSVTAAIGALTATENIPLIAPAATENEVTSVGSTVFQLNSNLERKGEALAQYAVDTLGLRTFATLAPADEYGQQLTSSFTSKIDRLGGRIIAQSWYYGDPQDLSRQFKAIREAAFHYDSTDVEQMILEAEQRGEKLEERNIPVQSIDGFFMPVYTEHIKYVAPQFALHNISTQILGGEYWDDVDVLKRAQIQRYINGVIFVSDYFPDEDSQRFRRFRTGFRLKMGTTPERWEAFGYDAIGVLKSAWKAGARSPQAIVEKLNALTNYEGIKGRVTFKDNNRVNKEVNFLQFVNGRIIKLK